MTASLNFACGANGIRQRVGSRLAMRTAASEVEMLRHRILAAAAQRLAAHDAPQRQDTAPQRTEAHDGNPCIIGTAGVEAATRTQQGAQQAFVGTKQEEQESGHFVHAAPTARGM